MASSVALHSNAALRDDFISTSPPRCWHYVHSNSLSLAPSLSLSLASSTADFLLTQSRQTWSITSSLTMKQDSEGFAWQREGGEEERAQRLPHRFSFSPVPVNRAAWYHSSASRVCFKKQNKHSRQSPLLAVWYRAKTFASTHSHTRPRPCTLILPHSVTVFLAFYENLSIFIFTRLFVWQDDASPRDRMKTRLKGESWVGLSANDITDRRSKG